MSDPLLTVRSPPEHADIIVVLGGDGPPRADRAAELYRSGLASRLLVSGDGDCRDIAGQMVRSGVAPQAIEIECASRSTAENASFSAPLLRAAHIRKAILVTSWYHSRRAMETFESEMPEIKWLSIPVEPDGSSISIAASEEGLQLNKEYPKTIVYRWRRFMRNQQTSVGRWLFGADAQNPMETAR